MLVDKLGNRLLERPVDDPSEAAGFVVPGAALLQESEM
jgi:hypothetical protein